MPGQYKEISLLDLATYTPSLPGLPATFDPRDEANPCADNTAQQLYKFPSEYTPRYDPGTHY